jgi:hypothetical protein
MFILYSPLTKKLIFIVASNILLLLYTSTFTNLQSAKYKMSLLSIDDGKVQMWTNSEGLLHRDDDLPALIDNESKVQIWYKNGKRHREKKPAYMSPDKNIWYKDGLLHCDTEAAYSSFKEKINKWYKHGELIMIVDKISGHTYNKYKNMWYRDDLLYYDKDACILFDENFTKWYIDGELTMSVDRVTGDTYNSFGQLHSFYDRPSKSDSNITSWHKNGEYHREDDLPAVIEDSYNKHSQSWYKNGKLHREDDLPAVTIKIALTKEMRWYKHGKLHRSGLRPAIIQIYLFNVNKYYAYGEKYNPSKIARAISLVSEIRKKRNEKIKIVSGLTPLRYHRLLKLVRSLPFIEWWYHPDNIGGKILISRMARNF